MKILTRRIVVQKTPEELQSIISSCSYRFTRIIFTGKDFSFLCPKRFNGGIVGLFPIKGTISPIGTNLEVSLYACADIPFYFGILLAICAIAGIIRHFFLGLSECIFYIGVLLFGLLLMARTVWESSSLLDLIEKKIYS